VNSKNKTTVRNREAVRVLSISQKGAGGWLTIAPDGSYSTKIGSPELVIGLQRRYGLNLSAAKAANDAITATGEIVDYLGDDIANQGEHTRRHNAVVRAWYNVLAAVAVGPVVLGDKEKPENTVIFNDGHVADLVEVSGNEDGSDAIHEVKCPTSLKKHYAAGHGSAKGGAPATAGHIYGFGSTLEQYRLMTLGCKKQGKSGGPPFNHHTGRGYVAEHIGHYADALNKKNTVALILVEALGGIAPTTLNELHKLASRTKGHGAYDRTRYGRTRASPTSFVTHHMQQISKAAVVNDSKAILKGIISRKQKACSCTPSTTGAAYAASGAWHA
jgi:hypothetical protein